MRLFLVSLLLLMVWACSHQDVDYCKMKGAKEGTRDFGDCLAYYQHQQDIFNNDLYACRDKASETYPPYLYSYPRSYSSIAVDRFGAIHPYHGHGYYYDDYDRNFELDRLRNRIIEPCMHDKGWNSTKTWMAGRH